MRRATSWPAAAASATHYSPTQAASQPLELYLSPGFAFSNSLASCEEVHPQYRGLSPLALEQAFRAEYPRLLEAIASANAGMSPATAPRLLAHLEAELPPALTRLAPGGDCVLVAIPPGLLPLLEHAAECCESSLEAGRARLAVATAKAALSLLSCLRFGGANSAAGYAAVAVRCKQALKAAYDAGAAVTQEDIVQLHTTCARASGCLWLTPYFGHRCAGLVEDFVASGWINGELAVRFTEAFCELTGQGRYSQVTCKFVRLVQAALKHPLSVDQIKRLLAAAGKLPVEMRIELELHARTEPADCWYRQLTQRLQRGEARQLGQARRTALRTAFAPLPQPAGKAGHVAGASPQAAAVPAAVQCA